jgi:hypothetical protein
MVGINEMLLATAEAPLGGIEESGMVPPSSLPQLRCKPAANTVLTLSSFSVVFEKYC